MGNILQAVAIVTPILFVLALGFAAAKAKAFPSGSIPVLNELVLDFALPASLFVGTVSVSRSTLLSEGTAFLAMLITLLAAYALVLAVSLLLFRHNLSQAAIQAIAVTFAAGPFYGPALLDSLFKASTGPGVAISMIAILLNLVIVPTTTVLLEIDKRRRAVAPAPAADGSGAPGTPAPAAAASGPSVGIGRLVGGALFKAVFKTPFVWAPLLAIVLVLVGVDMPDVIDNSLSLIGNTTGGVAVFVAGLTLGVNRLAVKWETVYNVVLKNIGLPALFFGVAVLLGAASGTAFEQSLLLMALPTGPMAVLLATRYRQYEREASSTLALSTVFMVVSVTGLVLMLGL